MAIYGFSWMLPSALGIYLAGLIMDNYNPDLVWVAAGAVAIIPVLVFLALHRLRVVEEMPADVVGRTAVVDPMPGEETVGVA
jgi:MFS family permease